MLNIAVVGAALDVARLETSAEDEGGKGAAEDDAGSEAEEARNFSPTLLMGLSVADAARVTLVAIAVEELTNIVLACAIEPKAALTG